MEFSTDAVAKFHDGLICQDGLFDALFSPEALFEVFEKKFQKTSAKGLDRLSGPQFSRFAPEELISVSRKCADGRFRFTAYLESLKAKGRAKPPRLIGIPTVRDRVVLVQLNRFLAAVFASCVPRNVASGYVRIISSDIQARDLSETWVCGTDIKNFYDDIPRSSLLSVVAQRVTNAGALDLVARAVGTPIVPATARRKSYKEYKTQQGVPQGLAISNLLAAIYLEDVDTALRGMPITYYRYVDDVLMYGAKEDINTAFGFLRGRLIAKGLALHELDSGKTTIDVATTPFSYLGYLFRLPLVTVREATIERFLQAVAAKFTDFKYGKNRLLKKYDYLDEARVKEIFLLELNERITGAISENKRYGWISYFNQINDFSLLAKMDHVIAEMFGRMPEFGFKAPLGLKTLKRAYYEMKYRADEGYVHNYDVIVDRAQRLVFLVERGLIGPKERISDEEITQRYEAYRARVLRDMHSDEGVVY